MVHKRKPRQKNVRLTEHDFKRATRVRKVRAITDTDIFTMGVLFYEEGLPPLKED